MSSHPGSSFRRDDPNTSDVAQARLSPYRRSRHTEPSAVLEGGDPSRAPQSLGGASRTQPARGWPAVSWDDPDEL
ncbi:hypothetical protein [Paraoerskovia marina]|uniref:Uncharacterized protein n=1 Tax=Paraoerskovia marina TaxID=545619 RepID=A0A1H1SHD8_9CELL|nr:hypothetical protein [Paraoerskovia marina]SDS47228.1 hypothetical protein SAMN04489860_1626 [Paraoerskovia marina]